MLFNCQLALNFYLTLYYAEMHDSECICHIFAVWSNKYSIIPSVVSLHLQPLFAVFNWNAVKIIGWSQELINVINDSEQDLQMRMHVCDLTLTN